MKILRFILIVLFATAHFNTCMGKTKNLSTDIEGLWILTDDTAAKFPHGTQKIVLQICRNTNNVLTARGIFLWNGNYQSEWKLVNIQYDKITRSITILDSDEDTLKAVLEGDGKMITGKVHLKSNTQNPLNFVRADKNLEVKLFYPRIPDKNGKITYSYKKPEQIDDGLKTASIYDKNINSEALINLMERIIIQKYGRMESLLILKDNKLIIEEYFYGYDRTQTHNIHSCTKSITSLLLGMVLNRHKNINTDQSLFRFFPQYDSLRTENKAQITLKNILTMTAGFHDHEGPPEKDKAGDPYRYILSKPLKTKPGEVFKYSNESTDLIGGVIYSLEGKRADEFAKEHLFISLGIHKYFWEIENGITHCHSDLHLLPRDMAKIGLLVLNDGKWQNKQIVPKEWIYESTKPHVKESKFFDYGYQWWHRFRNNLQWWKKPNTVSPKEHDMILALGYGGQYIIVIKDLNIVVVTTASDYDYSDTGRKARSKVPMVIEEIVPALSKNE
jgi:CubicO group peptidase (beta-lactamase class C family)